MTTRILVVDDSSADRLMIKSMLGHYTVQTASNGQEGLALLEAEGPFDMVILDINMPVMNGFEFLEIIKQKGLLRNLRVMILTNYDENDNEIRGLQMGAVDYIRKPIQLESLIARIEIHTELLRMQKLLEEEFSKQTQTYNKIYQQAPIGIAVSFNREPCTEDENPYININPVYEEITGYSSEMLRRIGWETLTHPDDISENLHYYERMVLGEIEGYTMDKRFLRPDGTYVWVNMVVSKIDLHANHKYNHVSMIQDITLRKEAEQRLMESERSKSVLLSHLPGLAYRCKYDENWTMEFVSDGAKELTGYDPEELLHNQAIPFEDIIGVEYRNTLRKAWSELLPLRQTLNAEYEIVRKDGSRIWVLEKGQGIFNGEGELEALEGIILDVTEKKRMEENLKFQMAHDSWTGIRNQYSLDKVLTGELNRHDGSSKALMAVNLSYLHVVTLIYGYHYTQDLIKKIADTLLLYCSSDKSLYKFQDNQFVFYFHEVSSKEDILQFAKDLHESLENLLLLERINLGFGVVEFKSHQNTDGDRLLKSMLIASEKGLENQEQLPISFFDEEMEAGLVREEEIKKELVQITDHINQERLSLHYQPILNIKDHTIVGFEALARLDSVYLGKVSPVEFIAVAEKSKLIIPIGERIIDMALRFIKRLYHQGFTTYWVSINISPIQLLKEDFCAYLLNAMSLYQVSPESIHIEITETVFSSDYDDINRTLGVLKAHGIHISIDDFGTGYSSLSRERELNINCLKIDKSFIDKLTEKEENSAITGDIIVMAHRLGHTVIAEGVENEKQLNYLKSHQCDLVQGYYFYKPIEEDKIFEVLL